jgi:ribosomal protein L29
MTKTKSEKTIANLDELKIKYADIRLKIKSGQDKNTNAHKALKKEIAQILTSKRS